MTDQERNDIYNRLLAMEFSINFQAIPNPRYINEKLGECHILLAEVEKYYIKINRETSVIQKAYNDSQASYESEYETMLSSNEEIKSLPNIKDREARLKTILRPKLKDIKIYENNLTDLNNLLKAVNLKQKNLNQANNDIKVQVRIMESHIRLNESLDDSAGTPISENIKRDMTAVATDMSVSTVVDSSEPLNMDNLLGGEEEPQEEEIPDKLVDPDSEPGLELEDPEDAINISDEAKKEAEEPVDSPVIEIDRIVPDNPQTTKNPETGGDPVPEVKKESDQNHIKKGEIDVDSLLKQFA